MKKRFLSLLLTFSIALSVVPIVSAAGVHTITFNSQGGSAVTPNPRQTESDGTLAELPSATRAGWHFAGWFDAPTDGEEITTIKQFSAPATVHAQWTAVEITFNSNGGYPEPAAMTLPITGAQLGRVGALPTAPTRVGHQFLGWFTHNEATPPNPVGSEPNGVLLTVGNSGIQHSANTTYYAKWRLANVIFHVNGGEALNENQRSMMTLEDGTLLSAPPAMPTPTRTGHAFDGWWTTTTGNAPSPAGSNPNGVQVFQNPTPPATAPVATIFTGDTTVYAKWVQTRTITFNHNFSGAPANITATTKADGTVDLTTLPAPTRPGFRFDGWFSVQQQTGGTLLELSTPHTANTTYWARWSAIVVAFNQNHTTAPAPTTQTVGANGRLSSLPAPTRAGHVFAGWWTEPGSGGLAVGIQVTTNYTFAAEQGDALPITVYARWISGDPITITFDSNVTTGGGLANPPPVIIASGGTLVGVTPTPPERRGFHFRGWSLTRTGALLNTDTEDFDSNTTLYAIWQPITVFFELNEGRWLGTTQQDFALVGENGRLGFLPTPVRTGHRFLGWFTTQEDLPNALPPVIGTQITTDYTFTSHNINNTNPTNIYARWTPIMVGFNPNAADAAVHPLSAPVRAQDGRLQTLPTPIRTGNWHFDGWFTAQTGGDKVSAFAPCKPCTPTDPCKPDATPIRVCAPLPVAEYCDPGEPCCDNFNCILADCTRMPRATWHNRCSPCRPASGTIFLADTPLFAQWSQIVTVTFDLQGGSQNPGSPTSVQTGEGGRLVMKDFEDNDEEVTHNLHIPTRTGHTFLGWYTSLTGGSPVTLDTIFNSNTTLFARWVLNAQAPVVTFDPQGGMVFPNTMRVASSGRLDIFPEPPVRTNFDFMGWFTAATGGEKVDAGFRHGTLFTANITLYAQWTNVKVDFYNNWDNGENPRADWHSTEFAGPDGRLTIPFLPTPEPRQYLPGTTDPDPNQFFMGWFTLPRLGERVIVDRAYGENTSVYARWSDTPSLITFNRNYTTGDTIARGVPGQPFLPIPPDVPCGGPDNDLTVLCSPCISIPPALVCVPSTPTGHYRLFPNGNTQALRATTTGALPAAFVDEVTTNERGRIETLPTAPFRQDITANNVQNWAFNGWYTARSGGTRVTTTTQFGIGTVTEVFAQWSPIRNVGFDLHNGVLPEGTPELLQTGVFGRVIYLPTPTREGFTFAGWFSVATAGTPVTTETAIATAVGATPIIIHARWVPRTVTFDSQGGSAVAPLTRVTAGTLTGNTPAGNVGVGRLPATPALPNPTRVGFTFEGWWTAPNGGGEQLVLGPEGTVFNEDATVFAYWKAIPIVVTFNAGAGASVTFPGQGGTLALPTIITGEDGKLPFEEELPIPQRPGFAFNGWFTAATGGEAIDLDRIYIINTTLFAQWTQIRKVTFSAGEGATVTPNEAWTGANGRLMLEELPIPTRPGFSFDGWFTTNTPAGVEVFIDRIYTVDTTIHAKWSPIRMITFNAQGGNIDGESTVEFQTGSGGVLEIPEFPVPTRTLFAFNGWYTEPEGGKLVTLDDIYTQNTTVHAQWSRIWTVSFITLGGTLPEDVENTARTGRFGKLEGGLPVPERDGYDFVHWVYVCKETGDDIVADFDTIYLETTTLLARWAKITPPLHLITFDPVGGELSEGDDSKIVPHGEAIGALPVPTHGTAYSFVGWFTAKEDGERVEITDIITEDLTFFAVWSSNYSHGFILNGDRITIGDALEVLKFLAGIQDNVITNGGENSIAWRAALITEDSQRLGRPRINDVLEILKWLAKIPGVLSGGDETKIPDPPTPPTDETE
jgi:uncharacterized repeat protein (TIGR02543 family)